MAISSKEDLCYLYIDDVVSGRRIVILFPYELYSYNIMKDNLKEMQKYVIDYVKAEDSMNLNHNKILEVSFDSLKDKYAQLRDDSQKEMDRLSELMNVGISPYAWFSKGKIDGQIENMKIKADYSFVLEKI